MAKRAQGPRDRGRASRALLERAFELARELSIESLLIQASAVPLDPELRELHEGAQIIWLKPGDATLPRRRKRDRVIAVPSIQLTRMSQIRLGAFVALLNGYLAPDETVICLSGPHAQEHVDTLVVLNLGREFRWFPSRSQGIDDLSQTAPLAVVQRVLEIAVKFASEGREGRPIGALFAIGDGHELDPFTRQLVLNPLHGHLRRLRSIQDDAFVESLRELVAMDGAVVIDRRGIATSAGTYLDPPPHARRAIRGLGARHAAAAAVTASADSVVITISESSGAVRLFYRGKIALEIERGEYLQHGGGSRPPSA